MAVTRAHIGSYDVVECAACGIQTTCPMPSPDVLRNVYAGGYYGGQEAARFRYQPLQRVVQYFRWRRARMLRRRLGGLHGRRILDVGCGRGDMLGWLQCWGADVYGTEVSPDAARVAGRLVGSDRIFMGELTEAKHPPASFDCITAWHVLEHVRAPDQLLREVARLLRPGGVAYIEVPNAAAWAARRFGERWVAYDIPKHLFHFSPDTLHALARGAGLRRVDEDHFSLEYSPVTLLQSVLSAAFGGDSALFRQLTSENDLDGRTRPGALTLLAHVVVAAVLVVPAVVMSIILGWRHSGDTYGAYFAPASASVSAATHRRSQ